MKTSTLATAASILSATHAATVTLETTACLDKSVPYGQQFPITLNTPNAEPKDLPAVCGLKIISASPDIAINSITCQAFRDTAGTQPGSATFTYASQAYIATNPVQEKSIKCWTSAANVKRQANATASASRSESRLVAVSTSVGTASASSDGKTVTSSAAGSASSGVPRSSANGTVAVSSETLRTTSATSATSATAVPSGNAAAGKMGVGMGVVFGAVVAMLG